MRVLVIPDVHLKPFMFARVETLLETELKGLIDQIICMMDIPDDWRRQHQLDLYKSTFESAIAFHRNHPDMLWSYGNHDLCYFWDLRESGYSEQAAYLVRSYIDKMQDLIPHEQLRYVHRIDNCIFSHAGISESWLLNHHLFQSDERYNDIDFVIQAINGFSEKRMWTQTSPIWMRFPTMPFYNEIPAYKSQTHLHVVGHTPVQKAIKSHNVLFTDTFSTYQNGEPIGTQAFTIVDTETMQFYTVK